MDKLRDMTHERRLALGVLAFVPGNLSLIAALTLHFALPFASVEFTKGFFIGLSIVMDGTAILLLTKAVNARLRKSAPISREAR